MQKKIIALAVAGLIAAPVFAQSSVAISGYVTQGVAFTKVSGDAVTPANNGTGSSIYDPRYSRIRFSGVEDLGGGLKADFMIETRLLADTATLNGFGGGNNWVGLSGKWGSLKLGRIDKFYSDGVGIELSRANSFSSHGTLSLLAQREGAYDAGVSRWNNLIQYDTPRMNGFAATLAYSSRFAGMDGQLQANADKGDAWYASANYMNGPIYVGASLYDSDTEGNLVGAGTNGYRVYGSYTFGMGLKIGFAYDHTKADAGAGAFSKRNAWLLPITYMTGPHAIYFAYGRAGTTKTQAGSTPNTGARFFNLGYDYALSKRTSVGANWTEMRNKSASTYELFMNAALTTDLGAPRVVAAGQDSRQFGINIAHTF
ncbi:MAG: Outer membrane porin protein 32 precursor [Betaproteobacteria bacterium ADurb.Bin341]|nr:MAG: Outer membrane porin protein 32 precursor [Betaproteobacteria bacterium ADurb.Bin341]